MHVPKLGAGAAIELTTNELLAALRDAPVVRKAVEDKSAAVANRRKELAADLEKLERQAAKDYDDQNSQIAAAQEAVRAVEQALQAARAKLSQANAARTTASFTYDRQRSEIETELVAGAHPAIATFIEWCRDEWHRAQRTPIVVESDVVKNKVTGRKVETRTTNHSTIVERIDALRAAITEAEDLRLQADQTSVPSQLDALRANLPVIK